MDFAKAIEEIEKAEKIAIVSHYDCDGLCSAKILSTALERKSKEIEIKIVKEISDKIAEEIKTLEKDLIIFSDIGSGYLSMLPKEKKIISPYKYQNLYFPLLTAPNSMIRWRWK